MTEQPDPLPADSIPSRAVASGAARVAGVIGWPVRHSLSPRLHGYWLQRYGIDGAYIPLAVAPDNFRRCLRALPDMGFAGANVTIPHKEAALDEVDTLTKRARRIGAVNTVTVTDNGKLHGDNTDAFGFAQSLADAVPDWRGKGEQAVVLGAGGAARAVCVALFEAGIGEIRLVNRTGGRADSLAKDLEGAITVWPWEYRSEALEKGSILVNTTTLGMGGEGELKIELSLLSPDAVVCDIVYVPLRTKLLRAADARGNPLVDGLGMLLHQARPGFAAWFGTEPRVSENLRRFLIQGRRG